MSVLIAVPADGGTIVVEAPDELSPAGVVRAAKPGEVVHQASETLEQALETSLIPVARAVTKSLASISPDAVEVSLGLKLSAEAGVVISKVAGEASFEVKLSWTRDAGDGS